MPAHPPGPLSAVLLSVHVVAAVVLIGPIAAAASLFPRYGRQAGETVGGVAVARALHRICAGYGLVGLAVPVFGIATAVQLGALGQVWVWASIALTVLAGGLLALRIVPGQRRVLAERPGGSRAPAVGAELSRLAMVTGVFNLLWVVVVVLMIVRPGSTTGVWR